MDKTNKEQGFVNDQLRIELNELIIEKQEVIKAGDEFRQHMNATIDKLQKEVQKRKQEFNINLKEWHKQIDNLQENNSYKEDQIN